MKVLAIASLVFAVMAGSVHGQERISLTRLPSGAAPSLNLSDRSVLDKSDADRNKLEASLQNTVVAFDTRHDGTHKKLGLALTPFHYSPLELAYDPNGKNLMAQWRSVRTTAAGQSFPYQAFVGEFGTINFVISSKF